MPKATATVTLIAMPAREGGYRWHRETCKKVIANRVVPVEPGAGPNLACASCKPDLSTLPAKPAAAKAKEPKAVTAKPEAAPVEPPKVAKGETALDVLPRPLIAEAVDAALARLPKGRQTRVAGTFLVVAASEAQAVEDAITEHMRAIVAADRSANMYREGKLRKVRQAVRDAFPTVVPAKAARAKADEGESAVEAKRARADLVSQASKERRAVVVAAAQGKPAPATPALDQLNAEAQAKEARKAS